VTVNGRSCASCRLVECLGGKDEPTGDYTNIEAGARAMACSGRSAGGPVPLDESALDGTLAPLAYPHLLRQRGATVLGIGKGIVPNSTSPAGAPTVSPNANKVCGLFRLSIFCLRGCGLIRCILGICDKN
jgi:hypothetical protein